MQTLSLGRILAGFLILFLCYHGAEYMILFRNSIPGFFTGTALFLAAAFLIGIIQFGHHFRPWGLAANRTTLLQGCIGLCTGLIVYTTAWLAGVYFQMEVVAAVPDRATFITSGGLLVAGCFFSSLTEDMLTRGFVFAHLRGKIRPAVLVLLSSGIYTLNHIYRLNEPVYLVFIFLTGISLAIPLLLTRNIAYTIGFHWAGNIVYHLTSNVLRTTEGPNPFSPMVLMILFVAASIPLNLCICSELAKRGKAPASGVALLPLHLPASVIRRD
jgi:hypothetical protein